MANKAISELPQALNVNNQDLFVLEQSGIAKKLTAETFITEQGIIDALAEALDGHGGIQSVTLQSLSGRVRTYLITFSDGSATTFQVLDGTSIQSITKTSTAGLVDTYTVTMSDGTTSFFNVTNGSKITSIVKTSSNGLVDTYTITMSDGTTTNFDVTNGTASIDPTLSVSGRAADAKVTGDWLRSVTDPDIYLVNMLEYSTLDGTVLPGVSTDTNVETLYLIGSGTEGSNTLTINTSTSTVALSSFDASKYYNVIILYSDNDTQNVSIRYTDSTMYCFPAPKKNFTDCKLMSAMAGIHLSSAGYKWWAQCIYNATPRYCYKKEYIALYKAWNEDTNPLTKIGSYWWGKGLSNRKANNKPYINNDTTTYLNCFFNTGATASAPKGFSWSQNLGQRKGYVEIVLGAVVTVDSGVIDDGNLPTNTQITFEFYLDGTLAETKIKTTKEAEFIRFDFANADTGEIKVFVTGGANGFYARVSEIGWWVAPDDLPNKLLPDYESALLFMDSWGVFHDNATQVELNRLLAAGSVVSPLVLNESVGSTTSNWAVENFASKVLSHKVKTVLTDHEINDINTGVTQATFNNNMKNLLKAMQANGLKAVFVLQGHDTIGGAYSKYTFPFIADFATEAE